MTKITEIVVDGKTYIICGERISLHKAIKNLWTGSGLYSNPWYSKYKLFYSSETSSIKGHKDVFITRNGFEGYIRHITNTLDMARASRLLEEWYQIVPDKSAVEVVSPEPTQTVQTQLVLVEPIKVPADLICLKDSKAITTTLKVAEFFGKEHKNVLRDIQALECSEEFNRLNFERVEYFDSKGERRPYFEMTKDGFVFLVMGFTGKNAARFKEAYIA